MQIGESLHACHGGPLFSRVLCLKVDGILRACITFLSADTNFVKRHNAALWYNFKPV